MRTGVRRTGAALGVLLVAAAAGCGGDDEATWDCAAGQEVVLSVDDPGGDMDLTRVTPDGTSLIEIDWPDSDLSDPASRPGFSPDGDRMVVVRADGDYESAGPSATWLWTVAPDGTDPRPVTAGPVYDGEPDWSPDGTTIAFARVTRTETSSDWTLMLVDAGGEGEPRPLLADDPPDPVAPGRDRSPRWSPDGERLAFVRERSSGDDMELPLTTVLVVDRDGGGLREVAELPYVSTLDWSPDGRSLLASVGEPGDRSVLLLDVESGESHELIGDAAEAVFAPAGDGDGDDGGDPRLWYLTEFGKDLDEEWRLQLAHLDDGDDPTVEPIGEPIDVDAGFLYGTLGLAVRPCD